MAGLCDSESYRKGALELGLEANYVKSEPVLGNIVGKDTPCRK